MKFRGEFPEPKIKNMPGGQESLCRSTFSVQTSIFQNIAKQVIPFLVQYQTDKPRLPFMCEDMYRLIKVNYIPIFAFYCLFA